MDRTACVICQKAICEELRCPLTVLVPKEGTISPHQQCDIETTLRPSATGHRQRFRPHHQLIRSGIRKTRSQHLLRSSEYRGSNARAGSVHRRQSRACGSSDQIGDNWTHLCWNRRSSAETESSGASLKRLTLTKEFVAYYIRTGFRVEIPTHIEEDKT